MRTQELKWSFQAWGASGTTLFHKHGCTLLLKASGDRISFVSSVNSQQHTLFKMPDTDVNITLECKISNFIPRKIMRGKWIQAWMAYLYFYSILIPIFFAIQYKGRCSQFKRLYVKLFDSLTLFVNFQTYGKMYFLVY